MSRVYVGIAGNQSGCAVCATRSLDEGGYAIKRFNFQRTPSPTWLKEEVDAIGRYSKLFCYEAVLGKLLVNGLTSKLVVPDHPPEDFLLYLFGVCNDDFLKYVDQDSKRLFEAEMRALDSRSLGLALSVAQIALINSLAQMHYAALTKRLNPTAWLALI